MASNVRTDYAIGLKDETKAGFASIESNLSRLKTSFAGAFAALGAGVGIAGLTSAITQAVELGDKLKDMSTATGQSVEALAFLNYAAGQSGSSIESLNRLFLQLSKSLDGAISGAAPKAAAALDKLGLSAKQLSTLDLTAALSSIGERLKGLENPYERAAAGAAIFGKAFSENAALILEGNDGVGKLRDSFVSLGGTITKTQAEAFDGFNDSLGNLKSSSIGLGAAIAESVLPNITKMIDLMAKAISPANNFTGAIEDMLFASDERGISAKIADAQRRGQTAQVKALQEQLRLTRDQRQGAIDERVAAPSELTKKISQDLGKQAGTEAAATTATEAVRKTSRAIKDSLDTETDQVRRYLDSYAKERTDIERQAAARLESLRESIRTPRERAVRELAEFDQAFGSLSDEYGRKAVEVFNELNPELETTASATDKISASARDLGLTFSSAFEDAIVSGKSFSQILQGIGEDILRITTRSLVTEPLAEGFSDFFKEGAGSGIGKGIGNFFSGLFGGARANGGPVSAGRAYLVGERGPEIFSPKTGGTIIPNGAGGGITINNYGAAPSKVRERMVNGRRQIDQFFADAAASTTSSGMLAGVGIRPPLASR